MHLFSVWELIWLRWFIHYFIDILAQLVLQKVLYSDARITIIAFSKNSSVKCSKKNNFFHTFLSTKCNFSLKGPLGSSDVNGMEPYAQK